MPNILDVIEEQRAALLRRETGMINDLQVGYQSALDKLERESLRILRAEDLPSLVKQAQLIALVDDIQIEMQALDIISGRRIIMEQQRAIVQSYSDVVKMLETYGVGVQVNAEAVVRLAAGAVHAGPIQQLLAQNSLDAGAGAKEALLVGAIKGDNPLEIAQQMRQSMTATQYGVERIARTEVLRAYRGSVQDRTREQGFAGVVWVCAPDACAYCWAMSGTVYPSEKAMDTHPNCRCSWAPNVGDNQIPSGEDGFAELPDNEQRDILGPGKYAAYKDGRITLTDLAGHADHPIWGPIGFEKSLAEVLGQAA